jgi:DNA invertase Pin-like site-specific DNA recombinase
MRVAAYVRVSTPGQVKLQTIDQQLETIHRYVQNKGWELPDENVFRDDGFSGASLDVVVLLSPDRLARNGRSTRWSSSRSWRNAAVG